MMREELIAALERAEGPSRELDATIDVAVNGGSDRDLAYILTDIEGTTGPLPYTSSLDAALTLVAEGWAIERATIWPGVPAYVWLWECEQDREGKWWHSAGGKSNHKKRTGEGATPAIALCIAALKARA